MLKLNIFRDTSKSSTPGAGFAAVLATLLWFTAAGVASAQGIVKWVDAQGQTHYSDHAPTGQDAEAVSVHVSQSPTAPAAPAAGSNTVTTRRTEVAATTSTDAAAARETEEERRRAERREAAEEAKAQADKDLVDKCNQARETYCNEGADAIRQHDVARAQIQYGEAISARQDRISRGLRPGAMPPPPP